MKAKRRKEAKCIIGRAIAINPGDPNTQKVKFVIDGKMMIDKEGSLIKNKKKLLPKENRKKNKAR